MLEKFSEDDFWDLLGLAPSKTPQQLQAETNQPEQAPVSEESKEEDDEWAKYIPTSEPAPKEQVPEPPFKFIEEPESFEFIHEPEPVQPKPFEFLEEEKPQSFRYQELPAWYDPSWKLPSTYQQKEETEEPDALVGFEDFEFLDFPGPKVEPPKPATPPKIEEPI
jgi:hypothetical protein